jgi:hypothetical protein
MDAATIWRAIDIIRARSLIMAVVLPYYIFSLIAKIGVYLLILFLLPLNPAGTMLLTGISNPDQAGLPGGRSK